MSNSQLIEQFFEACAHDDVDKLRNLLAGDASLVRVGNPQAHHQGWTGLHEAAKRGHTKAAVVLLQHGADPNAREAGDNTYPLHWAAAHGHLEIVRALLDAGGDVHGIGDVHELDVIGWASFFRDPQSNAREMDAARREMVALLVERGARHHIFSAMSVGDLDMIRALVEENPQALERRISRFEQGQSPLHFAVNRQRHDILDLLIEMGAHLEAKDARGQTALNLAVLCGDKTSIQRLREAGATPPETVTRAHFTERMSQLASSVKKGVPMIYVPDVARALEWYVSIGFKELARYEEDGLVNFGMVSFGNAELMLNMHGKPGVHDASLWFYTDQIDGLYQLLKSRQLTAAQAALTGEPGELQGIEFQQDIEDMFYGARQFGIRDLNGYLLYFIQSTEG